MQELMSEIEETVATRGSSTQKRQFYKAVAGLGNRLNRFAPTSEMIEAGNKSLAAIQDSDSLLEQADVTFATGFSCLHAGDHEKASQLMMQSLELARRCGDRTTQARCLAYLTIVKRKSGDPQSVDKYLLETEEICETLQMREYVSVVLANRSWLAWKAGAQKDAAKLAEEALQNWMEHAPGYPFKWLALLQLIDIAFNNSNLDQAIEYANILLDRKNSRLINGVEEAFDTAVSAHASGATQDTNSSLTNALKRAEKAGYL